MKTGLTDAALLDRQTLEPWDRYYDATDTDWPPQENPYALRMRWSLLIAAVHLSINIILYDRLRMSGFNVERASMISLPG